MRRPFVCILLLSFVPLLCAQAYKWKDADGIMHYSETPPPNGARYSKISLANGDPPASAAAPPAASDDVAPPPAASTSTADTPANRAKLCGDLQRNLDQLRSGAALNVDDGKGHLAAMDANRRKRELDSAQSQYALYCGK